MEGNCIIPSSVAQQSVQIRRCPAEDSRTYVGQPDLRRKAGPATKLVRLIERLPLTIPTHPLYFMGFLEKSRFAHVAA